VLRVELESDYSLKLIIIYTNFAKIIAKILIAYSFFLFLGRITCMHCIGWMEQDGNE